MTNTNKSAALKMVYIVTVNGMLDRECGTEIEAAMLASLLGGSFFATWL